FVEVVVEMRVFVAVAVVILPEGVGVEVRHGDGLIRGGGSVVAVGVVLAYVVAGPLFIALAGIDAIPWIVPWRFGIEREFGFGEREQGRRMDVGRARHLLDDLGARVLGARARQNAQGRPNLLDPSLRQTTEEVFRRHIAEMRVGAEGVAGDARDEPAVASPDRAREDACEHLARDDAQALAVVREPAALGDRLDELRPGRMRRAIGLDRDVLGVESEDKQADQGHVVARIDLEALDQRLGAQRADDLSSLLGDLGTGLLRRRRVVASADRTILALCHVWLGDAEDHFVDLAVARIDREADLVALLRLRPGAIRSRRQFLAAVFVDLDPGAVLRHVRVDPRALGGDEGLAVDREAIVLCALGEKVFLPDDAEGLAFGLAEFAVPGEEARLLQRLAHLPPNNALALLGFELLPHRGLVLAQGGGNRAELAFPRHVARADLVENGGVDSRQQAQLADLAQGNRERAGDGLFRPVLGGETFDGAPQVHSRHRSADDILADRAHMVVVVGIFDEDINFREADRDGDADASRAIGDRQFAVLFRDDRRLKDTDGADAGGKRCVG